VKVLVLDNYDSFTYNLVHLVEKVSEAKVSVLKNDKIEMDEISGYDKIILSPGPGLPSQAGRMPELLKEFHRTKPILGVCLGLQAIGECFGSPLKNLRTVFHGVATEVHIKKKNDRLFRNCPEKFMAGRYHSWVIDEEKINPSLETLATDPFGLLMAVRHRRFDVCGVQFHPESVLSECGEEIVSNWLNS